MWASQPLKSNKCWAQKKKCCFHAKGKQKQKPKQKKNTYTHIECYSGIISTFSRSCRSTCYTRGTFHSNELNMVTREKNTYIQTKSHTHTRIHAHNQCIAAKTVHSHTDITWEGLFFQFLPFDNIPPCYFDVKVFFISFGLTCHLLLYLVYLFWHLVTIGWKTWWNMYDHKSYDWISEFQHFDMKLSWKWTFAWRYNYWDLMRVWFIRVTSFWLTQQRRLHTM